MKTITYAITACNELEEIQRLISFLKKHKRDVDNIFILWDEKNGSEEVWEYLEHQIEEDCNISYSSFNGNFANWKNYMNSYCRGDIIFNLDADELPHENLIKSLPKLIKINPNVDLFWVPRINTLEEDTQENILNYIKSQKWVINSKNHINSPDYQGRIYKNNPNIKWEGKVHEKIIGYKNYTRLPISEEYSIFHPKTLERQINQNLSYEKYSRNSFNTN